MKRWIFIVLFSIPFIGGAYSVDTHVLLTAEIIDFYNQFYPNNGIDQNLKEFLIEGSRQEDNPPRWLNHFYDPVYNRGLTVNFSSWLSAKNWAQNSDKQITFQYLPTMASILSFAQKEKIKNELLSNKDFTWQKALNYWENGDKEMAMYVLGHVVHLLEDMAVPDHTRNDPHPKDSPYEAFAKKAEINEELLLEKQPIILESIDGYFDNLAKYSNENFYSADTLGSKDYKEPTPSYFRKHGDGRVYELRVDKEFGDYFLARSDNLLSWTRAAGQSIDYNFILNDYWKRLSTKAVQHGAGLLALFFKEVNKDDEELKKVSKESKDSLLANLINTVKAVNSNDNFKEIAVISTEPINSAVSSEKTSSKDNAQKIIQCSFNASSTPNYKDVWINEVAWMGTANDSNNEWVELRNINGQKVDISGWWLVDKGDDIKINFPNDSFIPGYGFYLLERTDDQTLPFIAADIIYKGAIGNESEALQLFDRNCNLVDQVIAQSNWPAGNNTNKRTMERNSNLDWHDYSGSEDQGIFGSPKKGNSLFVPSGNGGSAIIVPSTPSGNNSINNGPGPDIKVQKVLINEFLFDAEESDEGKEFIELYNPSDQSVDLSSWSIQVISGSGQVSKKNFEADDKIQPKSFFLIWLGANEQADMVWASGSLNNTSATIYLVNNTDKIENGNDQDIVDFVSYDKNTLNGFTAGQSLEREDGANNFYLQSAPSPRNPNNKVVLEETSFLKNVVFYQNSEDSNYYIDLIFDKYPFITSGTNFWKILTFYLNNDPVNQELISTDNNWTPQSDNLLAIQYPTYSGEGPPRYSLVLPDTMERFGTGGGISHVAFNYNFIQDNSLKVKVVGSATSTDYLTVAYYDFESSGGGSQNFKLKSADTKRYYFSPDFN